MVDTAHVMRQMELNADSGIKDFFLIVERPNGMVEYSGSLPPEQVVEMLAQGQDGPRGDYRCLKVTPYFWPSKTSRFSRKSHEEAWHVEAYRRWNHDLVVGFPNKVDKEVKMVVLMDGSMDK